MPHDGFGEDVAAGYDDDDGAEFEPAVIERTVDVLAALTGSGPALELAVGTGRIALPLAARGIRVDGIDLSEAMVERLRRKPGGEAVRVTIGDMATTRVGEDYALVFWSSTPSATSRRRTRRSRASPTPPRTCARAGTSWSRSGCPTSSACRTASASAPSASPGTTSASTSTTS